MKTKLFFTVLLLAAGLNLAGTNLLEVSGSWDGEIAVSGIQIGIEVDFEANDPITGKLSIPMQGLHNAELRIIEHTEDAITFMLPIPSADAIFHGTRVENSLSGSYEQVGMLGTFSLTKLDRARVIPPEADYIPQGCCEEDVSLSTETGILKGSLMLPSDNSKRTVVLIVAGSGPTDRDGNSGLMPAKNNSLLMLAAGLAENGIASLRYDKRGVADSFAAMIEQSQLRIGTYAGDLTAWVRLLRADARFDRVVVLGHSEGSLLGLISAGETAPDAFISLAGPGRNFADLLRSQLLREGSAFSPEEIDHILSEIREGRLVDEIPEGLISVFNQSVQPYLTSSFAVSPTALISALEIPVLILQGDHDIQVSLEDSALLHNACPTAEYRLIPGMNHVLKSAPEDLASNMATYYQPDLPLAEGLIDAISTFITQQLLGN